jgi:benzaldehyde dehydrogenase (NAD)
MNLSPGSWTHHLATSWRSPSYARTTWTTVITVLAVCVAAALIMPIVGKGGMRLATEFGLYLSLAVMWNLLAGYGGLLSVGQQAYVGIGAYSFYAALVFGSWPLSLSFLAAAMIGGTAAVLFSPFLFRLRGPYFAVGTWVVAEVALLTIAAWDLFGGGAGVSVPVKIAREIGRTPAARDLTLFLAMLSILALVLGGSYFLLRSKTGLAMTAIRDSQRAAESLGINTLKIKLGLFVSVAAVTALLGGIVVLTKLRMTPDSAFSLIDWTAYVLFIVVIGGIGRFEGPIIGTIVFFVLRTLFADFGVFYLILLGVVAIAVMLREPEGLWGLISRRIHRDLFPMNRPYKPNSTRENKMGKYEMISDGDILSPEMAGSFFDGTFRPASGTPVPVTDKATGEELFQGGSATNDDVNEACQAAARAQVEWAAMSPIARGDVLRKFAQLCEEHAEEVGKWIIRETGSIPPKAPFEVMTSAREAIETASLTGQPLGYILSSEQARASYARRVPLGVVAVITPWNSPFILAARIILPALAMGNACVLKPDEQTPVCGGYLIAKLFEMAGVPKGVISVLPGGGDVGAALVENPHVNMVAFTGSTATGRKVGETAGRHLKKAALELGGNNATIVLEDADIDGAVNAAAFGSFFHQGQICFTIGRHLVHENIAEEYSQKLADKARSLHIGNPAIDQCHLGPIINEKQAARAEGLMKASIDMGARVLAGGKREELNFSPTVLTGVTPDMPIYTQETFGPVAPIVTFKTEEEALELANGVAYGLVASIFTTNQAKAMELSKKLRTGIVHINDQTVLHEVFGPIGGMGASGNGARSGGPSTMDEYSQWQWVTVNDTIPEYPF